MNLLPENHYEHEMMNRALRENESLRQQLAECENECEEQARLNGMGAEREVKLMGELERCQKGRDELAIQLEAGLHIANIAAMAAAKIKHDIPPIAEVEWLVELAPLIDNWLGMHKAHGISDFKHECVKEALAKLGADKTGEV